MQELVARISKLGVDYDQAHAKDMERLEKSNAPCMIAFRSSGQKEPAFRGSVLASARLRARQVRANVSYPYTCLFLPRPGPTFTALSEKVLEVGLKTVHSREIEQ